MQVVSNVSARDYIFMVNELFNKNFYDLTKHPELQWLLLSVCGSGKVEFYIKPAKKKKNKTENFIATITPT